MTDFERIATIHPDMDVKQVSPALQEAITETVFMMLENANHQQNSQVLQVYSAAMLIDQT